MPVLHVHYQNPELTLAASGLHEPTDTSMLLPQELIVVAGSPEDLVFHAEGGAVSHTQAAQTAFTGLDDRDGVACRARLRASG